QRDHRRQTDDRQPALTQHLAGNARERERPTHFFYARLTAKQPPDRKECVLKKLAILGDAIFQRGNERKLANASRRDESRIFSWWKNDGDELRAALDRERKRLAMRMLENDAELRKPGNGLTVGVEDPLEGTTASDVDGVCGNDSHCTRV